MPTFKLSTGNLPAAVAATAKTYETRKGLELPKIDGARWSFVGYKVTEKQSKSDAVLPQSFAVSVPVVDYTSLNHPRAGEFLDALVHKYQDQVIADCANKETDVDPTDWAAIVTDFFDTTRQRNVPTREKLVNWYDDVFTPAYIMRATENGTPENTMTTVIGTTKASKDNPSGTGYGKYTLLIAKADCVLSVPVLKGYRQTIEKLQELGLLESDDAVANYLVQKCKDHVAAQEKQVPEEIVAEI